MSFKQYVKSTKTFPPCPAGLTAAVVADVVVLPNVPDIFNPGAFVNQVRIVYCTDKLQDDGSPFRLFSTFKISFHESANMTKWIADTGANLTEDSDPDSLIGFQVQALVVHYKNDAGETKAKVRAFMPAVSGQDVQIPENLVRAKDKDAANEAGTTSQPGKPINMNKYRDVPRAIVAPAVNQAAGTLEEEPEDFNFNGYPSEEPSIPF